MCRFEYAVGTDCALSRRERQRSRKRSCGTWGRMFFPGGPRMIGTGHRRRVTGEYRRVLCPIDFSSAAEVGVERAARLAERNRATLVLLHVYAPVALYAPPEVAGFSLMPSEAAWRAEAEDQLRRTRDRLLLTGVATHALMVDGYPPDQIVRVARRLHCDLIVLATSGRRGLLRVLLGDSVPERVIRRAPCPVLAFCATQPSQAHGRASHRLKAAA